MSRYQKCKTNVDLLKQETVSGSGIIWAICKSASCSRQITMPAPHRSVFLQAGCPSCRPTNSVKALKGTCTGTNIHTSATCTSYWIQTVSHVCAVAQYAVLEAKVNGRGPFSHPHPSKTPQPISMSCQIYYYVPPGSGCAKFGWNRFGRYGSAHA